eukprot:4372702-Pyramimonas_sp.AAC.2
MPAARASHVRGGSVFHRNYSEDWFYLQRGRTGSGDGAGFGWGSLTVFRSQLSVPCQPSSASST